MTDQLSIKEAPIISNQLIFEPLSPIHVGGDSEKHMVEGFDYLIDKDKKVLSVINWSETFKRSPGLINEFSFYLADGKIPDVRKRELIIEAEFPLPVGNQFLELKRLIRNGFGKPYIPGTSIKGAILSIIIGELSQDLQPNDNRELYEKTVGNFNKSLQQFIRVSDVELDYLQLVKTKIFNLRTEDGSWVYGWKDALQGSNREKINIDNFSTTWEVFPENQGGDFRLSFGKVFPGYYNSVFTGLSNESKSIYSKIIEKGDSKALFELINKKTLSYLQAEIAFFNEFYTPEIQHVIDLYLQWIRDIQNSNSNFAIFRMASGSGFHSITGDWQFKDDHTSIGNSRNKRKSRRLIIDSEGKEWKAIPMGFVKIQLPEIWIEKEKNIEPVGEKFSLEQVEEDSNTQKQPSEPTIRKISDYPRGGGKVDAKVVGQEGMQMKVEVFLEGFEGKTLSVRYNDGLNYFGKDSIIELDLSFPAPKNRKQFNLNNPVKK